MNPIITLSHFEMGPIKVQVWDEATVWMGRRTWTCPDDPELGSFDDEDFDEHYTGEIDALLNADKDARPQVVPTYWCSFCGKTNVAERDTNGNVSCPECGE